MSITYVITFKDYLPAPREDGQPWTKALIYEAARPSGSWTLIDTVNFVDPDVDPSKPKSRTFTTENGSIEQGWYKVVFEDASNHQQEFGAVQNIAYPWVPSLNQVGALVRTRTKDSSGNELGTFNEDTRPTSQDVQELIQQATDTFVVRGGTEIPPELFQEVQRLIALRAAMLVEISYFPEQVATGRSPYNQYMELWSEGYGDAKCKGALIQALESVKMDDTSITQVQPGEAVFNFPRASNIAGRPW